MPEENELEVPCTYILLIMMNSVRKFGVKDSVTYDQVSKYFDKYMEEVEINVEDMGYENVTFQEFDLDEEIEEFLEVYSDFFYSDGDSIYIHDGVDMDIIDDTIIEIELEDKIDEVFEVPNANIEFLKIIGCTYLHKHASKLLALEFDIEKKYQEYAMNPTQDNKRTLASRKLVKTFNMENLKTLSGYYISGVVTSIYNFIEQNRHDYKELPINEALWESVPHRFNYEKGPIFCDDYQYAIFGESPLGFFKLAGQLDYALEEKNVEEGIPAEGMLKDLEKERKINKVYYRRYLKYLNEYMEKNEPTPELIKVKARLSYFLDDNDEFSLDYSSEDLEDKSFESVKLKATNIKKLADEAEYFILELFSLYEDPNRIKKLIMMKTYYSLTHDREFIDIFETYCDEPGYDEYRQFVFGKSKTLSL